MSFTVNHEFDLTREAAQLLIYRAASDTERFSGSLSTVPPAADRSEAARILAGAVDALFTRLALTSEELALFAPDLSQTPEHTDENSLMAPFICGSMLGYEEIVRRVHSASEADMRAFLFSYILSDENSGEVCDTWANRDAHVFTRNVLAHPDWNCEQKCHVLGVYNDYRKNFDRAAAILSRCIDALEGFAPRLEPLLHTYESALKPLDEDGHPQFLSAVESIRPFFGLNNVFVRPSLSQPKALTLQLRRLGGTLTPTESLFPDIEGLYIYIGLYIPYIPDLLRNQTVVKPDELIGLLKSLSDKSKFDILCILSGEACYAAQLAQRLCLSPATISHHMNVLLNAGLVLMDERDNRIYYQLHTERVRALVRTLEDVLLSSPPARK